MQHMVCTVDWLAVAGIFRDIVVAIAAIVTATVACIGISEWRAEESGKADFDLARRLGTAVYRYRDAIEAARYPFVLAEEFPERKPPAKGDEASAYADVFNRRFEGVRQSAISLDALRNEAEALWGKGIVEKLSLLLRYSMTLQLAMRAVVADKRADGATAASVNLRKVMEARVFDTGNGISADGSEGAPNEFTTKIQQAVEDVAAYLRSKLPQPSQPRD